jgi:hypothetical protein
VTPLSTNIQSMATMNDTAAGISRMSDEDYSLEFGTPRPCAQDMDNTSMPIPIPIPRWIFAEIAKNRAQETKRHVVSRTEYRMAANKRVSNAFDALEKSCEMIEADFRLLKNAIGNFNVRIRMFDSVTVNELVNMRMKAQLELADDRENKELTQWINELSTEIRRVNSSRPAGVPSQQAQLMRSSRSTLCNVLSPETAWRKFISLEKLTSAIRSDLIEFLTSEFRKHDRAEVVKQIKESVRKTRKASQ